VSPAQIQTILFDLDGTLLDTAPDLAQALNATLQANGRATLPFEQIRPAVSHGGSALIRLGFQLEPHIADQTRLFPGMEVVLQHIEAQGLTWGVVTNKPGWLTEPLLDALDLQRRAASVVCGDTLNECKPHPAPLLHACKRIGTPPGQCVYVGDAERDIKAGHNAGMATLLALFGYLMESDRPEDWGASALIQQPADILAWLG
jgi:HAD superfamily hydrolase (TIGR01509 family)